MKEILEYKVIEVGKYSLGVSGLLKVAIFLAFMLSVGILMRRLIYRSKRLDVAKKFSINQLSRYVIGVITVLFCLHLLGFNISVLLAGSAALMVGIGFGLQNLFNDFISGIILLLDGTLKVGDVIEVNNMICKVQQINFRTTSVISRDDNYVILPNSELTGGRVINWTHEQEYSRFRIDVGVAYGSDIELVMRILVESALSHGKVLRNPTPFVRFEDFGDSALKFSLFFFTNEVFRAERIKSDIRVTIDESFRNNSVSIPFPQRVVHMATK